MSADRFLRYCRWTCIGGSENGECPCPGPYACELKDDPDLPQAREEALERMGEYMAEQLNKSQKVHPIIRNALTPHFKPKPKN